MGITEVLTDGSWKSWVLEMPSKDTCGGVTKRERNMIVLNCVLDSIESDQVARMAPND